MCSIINPGAKSRFATLYTKGEQRAHGAASATGFKALQNKGYNDTGEFSYCCSSAQTTHEKFLERPRRQPHERVHPVFLSQSLTLSTSVSVSLLPNISWPKRDIVLLVFVCTRINHPFITSAHSHYPHYCNTIARLLRHIYTPPPRPTRYMPYTIQYW